MCWVDGSRHAPNPNCSTLWLWPGSHRAATSTFTVPIHQPLLQTSNFYSPTYCSHFPSRTFKHILVTSCYTLFPSLPFHFFHQSFFSSPTSLLWGVLFTSRCPQSRATVLGEALHPVWRWEPSQGEQTWNQSSSKPPLSFTSSLQNPQSSVGRGARLCLPDKHIPKNGDI